MDRSQGRKKSDFIAKSSVDAGGYLDYFVNGTNYKIAYDNFVSNLGVSGSIAAQGPVTAAPILSVDGAVNYIRGIEDGPGVVANISVEDGIKLSHSFTADTTGSPLFLNTTSQNPVIASLVAGDGISMASTDEYVTINAISAQTYGQLTMHGNTTNTVIAAIDTPTLVAGTWSVGIESGFTGTTAGRLTYTGVPDTTVQCSASVTLRPNTSNNQDLSVFFAKDGVPLTDAKITRTVSFSQTANVSLNFNIALETNDYIEIFVENTSSDDDILVTDALFGIA